VCGYRGEGYLSLKRTTILSKVIHNIFGFCEEYMRGPTSQENSGFVGRAGPDSILFVRRRKHHIMDTKRHEKIIEKNAGKTLTFGRGK
jgi:hypothetical protein